MRSQSHILLLCLALIGLPGCSSQFAYNHADWLANWYVDDYLDLSKEQNEILSTELESVLAWHRKTQLPLYKNQLLALVNDLKTLPISEHAWQEHLSLITQHWHETRKEISYRAAKLAPLLTATQVDDLFKKLQQKNQQQLAEFSEHTLAHYQQQRLEKIRDTLDDLLGSVSAQQIAMVTVYLEESTVTEQAWYDSKVALQAAMQSAFNQQTPEQLPSALFDLMSNPDQFKSEYHLQTRAHNRTLLITMLHKISASLSAKQREHFNNEITERLKLIERLVKG